MQKSLFRKYLEITMVVILVSFIFLGSVVMFFITRYWSTERTQLLRNNAYGVANVAAKSLISEKNNRFTIDGERMEEFVSAFSENINAYILVTDVEGNIVMEHRGVSLETRSDLAGEAQETEKIDSEVVNEVIEESEYSGVGTLNGYFDENCYVVAVPILIENGAGLERTVGIAVAASSTQVLSGYRAEMVKLFILAAMAAIIVAFGVAWLFSYRMPTVRSSPAPFSIRIGTATT